MTVRLQIFDPSPKPALLGKPLRRLLKLLGIKGGAWSITVVRDHEMKALHKRSMNLGTTTDVLTFDMSDPDEGTRRPLDLDTVICVDEARRRAEEFGHSVDHELLLYALHSLLHVQGYDDLTPGQFKRMHAREDELLTQIGMGPIFESKRETQNAKRRTKGKTSLPIRKSKTRRPGAPVITNRKSPRGAP